MKCIKCFNETKVVDRRGVRRRRECTACGARFTTEETVVGAKKQEPRTTAPKSPKPKKESVASNLKKASSARRKIEDRKDRLYGEQDEYEFINLKDLL